MGAPTGADWRGSLPRVRPHGMHPAQPVKVTMTGPIPATTGRRPAYFRQFRQFDVEAIGDGTGHRRRIVELGRGSSRAG